MSGGGNVRRTFPPEGEVSGGGNVRLPFGIMYPLTVLPRYARSARGPIEPKPAWTFLTRIIVRIYSRRPTGSHFAARKVPFSVRTNWKSSHCANLLASWTHSRISAHAPKELALSSACTNQDYICSRTSSLNHYHISVRTNLTYLTLAIVDP